MAPQHSGAMPTLDIGVGEIPIGAIPSDRLPENLGIFFRSNSVRIFLAKRNALDASYKRVVGAEDRLLRIRHLQCVHTFLVCRDVFPNLSRRSPVVERITFVLPALDLAIQSVRQKASDVVRISAEHQRMLVAQNGNVTASQFGQLSMILNGSIDAAINGGITLYADAFFRPDYLEQHPGSVHRIRRLETAISEQLAVLKLALDIHANVQELAPFQRKLETIFSTLTEHVGDRVAGFNKNVAEIEARALPQ
eukprot:gnl/Dysnectes_brevis/2912_a3566_649.p2 GENE.gnl/Dysnectes_brevis/2912_a3566_649~~gnl/Dysnectes_brevis/2912_a3566_649.p2  ORF type:complete len:251 (-),score=112.64 gnl/Dysnectes_brevis/2912_a3566_649:1855-2607(-)